jgi:hypothetical protein
MLVIPSARRCEEMRHTFLVFYPALLTRRSADGFTPRMPLLRDPDGSWAKATKRQRILGLTLGILISVVPLILFLAVLFLVVTRPF